MYENLTDQELKLVDSVCEQFESEVRSDQDTAMEAWLTKVPETVREVLLGELIAIKYENHPIDELLVGKQNCRKHLPWFEPVIDRVFDELCRNKTSPVVDFKNEQPEKIGRFLIEKTIGRGGTGVVYLAKDTRLRRTLAVKVLSNATHASAKLKQRFIQEAELAAQLQLENVVRVFEAGEYQGYPYIALEYVDGPHLGKYTDGQPQNQKTAALWVRTLARAIEEAHRHGIIHRDLKPSNVLVKTRSDSSNGHASSEHGVRWDVPPTELDRTGGPVVLKVADFGLAKNINVDSELTATGTIAGTPQFMSPEQALGDVGDTGPSTDIYSLGAILYFLLTGRPPFLEATAVETILAVKRIEPVPPSTLVANVARDIETICLRCLEKKPERRFKSAAELADELDRFIGGTPIHSRPVGKMERFGRWCARNRSLAAIGLVCLVSIISGIVGVTWQWRKSVASEKRAIENGRLATVNAESAIRAQEEQQRLTSRLYFDRALTLANDNEVAEALHWFLAALSSSPGRSEDLHWERVVRHSYANWLDELHPLLNQHELERSIVSSNADPTGRFALLGCKNGLVYRIDLKNGEILGQPIRIDVGESGWTGVWATAFHPDADWFVVGVSDRGAAGSGHAGGLYAFDTATGSPLNQRLDLDLPVEGLCFNQDGSALYVAVGGDNDSRGRVLSVDADTFQVREASYPTGGAWHSLELTDDNLLKVFYKKDHHRNLVKADVLDPETLTRIEELGYVQRPVEALSTVYFESKDTERLGGISARVLGEGLIYSDTNGFVQVFGASPSSKRLPPWFRKKMQPINPEATQLDTVDLHPNLPGLVWGALDGWFHAMERNSKPAADQRESIAGRCRSVVFSPDGQWYAVASDRIRVFDYETGEPIGPWMHHDAEIGVLEFSPDSKWLAAGDYDQGVKLWNVENGKQIGQTMESADIVISLDFSSDGQRLAVGTASDFNANPQAMIWEVPKCRPLSPPLTMPSYVRRVQFSKDGKRLLTVSDNHFRIWDGVTGDPIGPKTRFSPSQNIAVFARGGDYVISGSGTGEIRAWDPCTGKPLEGKSFRTRQLVSCINADSDGDSFAVGFADGLVRVIDWHEFVPIGPAGRLPGAIKATRISPDGSAWAAVDLQGHYTEFQLHPAAKGSVDDLVNAAELATGIHLDSNLQRQSFTVEQWRQLGKRPKP